MRRSDRVQAAIHSVGILWSERTFDVTVTTVKTGKEDKPSGSIHRQQLFTLVLPDNKVVSQVLQKDWFTGRLFEPWKHYPSPSGRRVPPVTLLSHSDIGTF